MPRLAAIAAVVLLIASACGGSSPPHRVAVVTAAGRVGPLQLGVSDWDAIVAYAGDWEEQLTTKGGPGFPVYTGLGYGCDRKGPTFNPPPGNKVSAFLGCDTTYIVNRKTDRLVAFQTYSSDFRTPNGIRPGMAQDTADRLEHQTPHGPWDAIGEASPAAKLIIPAGDGSVFSLMLESRHHPIGLIFTS